MTNLQDCNGDDYSDSSDEDPVLSLCKDIQMEHSYCRIKPKEPVTTQNGPGIDTLLDHNMEDRT